MKTVKREELLTILQMVKPGLSNRESLEQSNCFVFKDGYVFTFNDEIACRKKLDLGLEGAVTADLLLSLLEKLPDENLAVLENEKGEIQFEGNAGKKCGMNRDADILLPIEKVLEEKPKNWKQLPEDFEDILAKVRNCVSTNEENFDLTCVHLHPNWIESGDNTQVIRWRVKTGLEEAVLVRGSSIGHLVGLSIAEVCVTPSWVHFKSTKGLIISCRKFQTEEYPDWSSVLEGDGTPVKLEKKIITAAECAALLAGEVVSGVEPQLEVLLRPNKAIIKGTGLLGWYREPKKITYSGPKIRFYIAPTLLCHITNEYNDCTIHDGKLRASGGYKEKVGKWTYVTVLQSKPKSPVEEEATEEKEAA
jgi:hypothetical protein